MATTKTCALIAPIRFFKFVYEMTCKFCTDGVSLYQAIGAESAPVKTDFRIFECKNCTTHFIFFFQCWDQSCGTELLKNLDMETLSVEYPYLFSNQASTT